MSRKSGYFREIERLLGVGYEPKHIIKITGIPKSTVYHIVNKLRTEARIEFNDLMEKDFLYKYQINLENYSKTIQQCNEKIDEIAKEYKILELSINSELEGIPENKASARAMLYSTLSTIQTNKNNDIQKFITLRDKATDAKARIYNQGPVVHAIDNWVRTTNPSNGTLNVLKMVEDEPKQSNMPISPEDLKVLKEMEEDELQ